MRLLDLEAKSPLYSHFIESLSGLVTIRAFGWGETFKVSFWRSNPNHKYCSKKLYLLDMYRNATLLYWMCRRSRIISCFVSSDGWHWLSI